MDVALFQQLVLLLLAAILVYLTRDTDAMTVYNEGEPPVGFTLTEGDILVPVAEKHARAQRKIVMKGTRMWPRDADGRLVVAYVITEAVNKYLVRQALSHWEQNTCVQFAEYASEEVVPKPYVRFVRSDMCASSVGLINKTAQNDIILSERCPLQSAIHETGHRLGFVHEQSRTDRDKFVSVVYDNVIPGMQKNFVVYSQTVNYSVPYDFSSIMHYDTMAFSNGKGPTILTRNPLYQEMLGEHFSRGGLSFMDAKIFNVAYGCIENWTQACADVVDSPCLNEGYMAYKMGRCFCACPLGTRGLHCEDKYLDYNDAILQRLSPRSGVVTSPITLDTRADDWNTLGTRFTKVITAPPCSKVKLTVTRLELMERINRVCRGGYVQIRLTNSSDDAGNIYCGVELTPGQTFASVGQTMVLHVRTFADSDFAATIDFEKQQNCS